MCDPDVCCATLRSGRACTHKSKARHPEHGPLCGTHLRTAARGVVECSICMCDVKARQCKRLECGHSFHARCIKKWFGRGSLTCPMCRAVCFAELRSSHPLVSERVRHLIHLVPPPPGICFAAYMLAMLHAPEVQDALGITVEEQQLLVELAYQSFTQVHFFEYMRQIQM